MRGYRRLGAKSDRPARNQPIEAARRRQFELVLLVRLDRWSHSVADCVRPQGGGKLTDGPRRPDDRQGAV